MSSSLKIIIPVLIVLILVAAGIYAIYKAQSTSTSITALASASPIATGFPTASQTPEPASKQQNQNTSSTQTQPKTGPHDGLEIKNEGIQVDSPTQATQVTSPLKVTGRANVTSQKVNIEVIDANGNILGRGQASACVGLDACPFEASIIFSKPTTSQGTIKLYSPSTVDSSQTYITTISVTFN